MLGQLKVDFDAKVYTGKKGSKLKVARVDVAEQYKWLEDEGLGSVFNPNDLPAILVMHDGKYYKYPGDSNVSNDLDDVSVLINFINRL